MPVLITKALLLYKALPISALFGGSGLLLYVKLTPSKSSDFTFISANQLSNKEEDGVFSKTNNDSGIFIKEYHPTFNTKEKQDYISEVVPIKAGHDTETLSLFNFSVSKGREGSKMYDEVFSVSLDKGHLENSLFKKRAPKALFTFYFSVNTDLLTHQPDSVDEPTKTITINHLLDAKQMMESNNLFVDSALIKVGDLELNLALNIQNFTNSDFIKISLVNKKTSAQLASSIGKRQLESSANPLDHVSFQHLKATLFYKSSSFSSGVDTDLSSKNKAEQFQAKPDQFIHANVDFNKNEAISKNWISPSFALGGFEEDRDESKAEAKFYIKKGNDTTNYKIFERPEEVLTAKLPESIFTTTQNNPGLYGGYIADVLAETPRPSIQRMEPTLKNGENNQSPIEKRYDNKWLECVSQKPAKSLCEHHDTYNGTQQNLGPYIFLPNHKFEETYIKRRSFEDISTKKLTYDEPTPAQGIHPFIAKQLLTVEDKYKDTGWQLPELATQYKQAILEQSNKPIKSKDYQAHIEAIKDRDKNITFPAYFLRTSHFWEPERDSQAKIDAPETHYSTNHQFSIKLFLKDWQKFLLNNDQFGQANIPDKDNPALRTGFNVKVPMSIEFQDTSFNSNINKRFDLSTFVNMESFKNNNEFIYTYSLIDHQHTHYAWTFLGFDDFYDRPNKYSGLELKSKLIVKVFLDDEKNINITYDFQINRFLQHVKTICDFRDFDREETIKYGILSECPNYYKMPAFFGVTLHETPIIAPYWYVNPSSKEQMSSYLAEDKLAERDMTKTQFLSSLDRQTRIIANLKPSRSKEKDVVEKYVSTSSWFSATYDRYASFFNYSIPRTKKNKEKKDEQYTPWLSEHWTSFEAPAALSNETNLVVGLESPDTSTAPLTINSKHPFSTKLSVWTNTSFKSTDSERSYDSFDKQKYQNEELDKKPNEVFQKQASPIELSIEPSIISANKDAPTWIPVRMALNINSEKNYSDIKAQLENLFVYMCKNDVEIKTSDIKNCKDATSTINNWDSKDEGLKTLDDKKYSFAFVNFGLFVYKENKDGKITFYIKSKLWGASFSNVLNSKQEVRDYGSEGSAGMRLSYLKISKPTKEVD